MDSYLEKTKHIKVIRPPVLGWLMETLSDEAMNHLWKCVENQNNECNELLAGNISQSKDLTDIDDWFAQNILVELFEKYSHSFHYYPQGTPRLSSMWVNYQKENEFNPLHQHSGVYSFVVWMKIPTSWRDQNFAKGTKPSTKPYRSSFTFTYTNILGETSNFEYRLDPEDEGTILFFPGKLSHQVYPFYNSDEVRVSISGNIDML